MRIGAVARRSVSAAVPVAMLLVPKCPLCVLSLFTAFGLALPPAPVLDALVGVAALAWLALLARARPSLAALAAGLGAALLLLGSRRIGLPAAGWAGAVTMAAVSLRVRAKKLGRAAGACGPAVRCDSASRLVGEAGRGSTGGTKQSRSAPTPLTRASA